MKSWMEYPAALALIVLFILLGATSARRKSATMDEFAHLAVGCYALKTHDFSLYMKTPPTGRMLLTLPAYALGPKVPPGDGARDDGWLPWAYGAGFMYENWSQYHRLLFAARGAVIAAGALLCVLVWQWSRRLYGPAGGLTSLAAAALSPTLIAHSRIVTTDVIVALAVGGYVMALLAYVRGPSLIRAALAGATLGLAVLCKFTAPMFAPLAVAAPVAAYFLARRGGKDGPRMRALIGQAALMVVLAWLVVVGGYFGRKVSFHRDLMVQSKTMAMVKPVTGQIPLPEEFLVGLDMQMVDAEQQEFVNGNYLLGKFYSGRKWYYYPVAVAAKEPVPYLLVLAAAVVLAIRRRPVLVDEVALVGIAVVFFVATSFFNTLQIGIRYLLVAYPLGFVLMGGVGRAVFASDINFKSRHAKAWQGLVIAAGVWALVGTIWIWPDYLAYFSPLTGGPDNGYRILLDSNLDWGQDLPGLKKWMDQNKVSSIDLAYFGHEDPLLYDIRYDVPGRGSRNRYIAISASFLMGRIYPLSYNPELIAKTDPLWSLLAGYRDREPVAKIGYTIFIYEKK